MSCFAFACTHSNVVLTTDPQLTAHPRCCLPHEVSISSSCSRQSEHVTPQAAAASRASAGELVDAARVCAAERSANAALRERSEAQDRALRERLEAQEQVTDAISRLPGVLTSACARVPYVRPRVHSSIGMWRFVIVSGWANNLLRRRMVRCENRLPCKQACNDLRARCTELSFEVRAAEEDLAISQMTQTAQLSQVCCRGTGRILPLACGMQHTTMRLSRACAERITRCWKFVQMKQLEAASKAAEDSQAEATAVQEALSSEARRAQVSLFTQNQHCCCTLLQDSAFEASASAGVAVPLPAGLLSAVGHMRSHAARRLPHGWC